MTPEAMLAEFNAAAFKLLDERGIPHPTPGLWWSLVREEIGELAAALDLRNRVMIADALADAVYVLYGLGQSLGIPMASVLAEIHRSNMTKFGPGATVRFDGKITKGSDYSPPDLARVLEQSV